MTVSLSNFIEASEDYKLLLEPTELFLKEKHSEKNSKQYLIFVFSRYFSNRLGFATVHINIQINKDTRLYYRKKVIGWVEQKTGRNHLYNIF
jgi:hypothetical protein